MSQELDERSFRHGYQFGKCNNSSARQQLLAESEWRRVARDECCGYLVSTVFLGIDHGLGAGPPVLFETMVFGDGSLDEHQERYCTAAEALAGHRRILDAIARGEKELMSDCPKCGAHGSGKAKPKGCAQSWREDRSSEPHNLQQGRR